MDLIIQKTSPVPLYQQIYDQILTQIITKKLPPNSPLPSIRLVARELNISVISVKNAYLALEQDGYIYTLPAKGSYISPLLSPEQIHDSLVSEATSWLRDFCDNYHIKVDEVIKKLQKKDRVE